MKPIGEQLASVAERVKRLAAINAEKESTREYDCDVCKDVGGVYETIVVSRVLQADGTFKEVEGTNYRECDCRKRKRLEAAINRSNIAMEFQNKTFGNFDTKTISRSVAAMFQTAVNYTKDARGGECLLLSGQCGSGKTHIACAVANNKMSKGIDVFYAPYLDIMNAISSNQFASKADVIKRMCDCQLLLIDDLHKPTQGAPTAHKWQVDIMAEVINYRYFNNLPIIISTELTVFELLEIDEATYSRVVQKTAGKYSAAVEKNIKDNYRVRGVI